MLLPSLTIFSVAAAAAKSCPDWTLPWGTYEGEADANDICVYSNIRFASPPVKDLRFGAPDYPPKSNPATPGPNPSCIQAQEIKCVSGSPFEAAQSCYPTNYGTPSEDCLFLDVYVPRQISQLPLPVVVWFYGGAYLFGSKSQYDPSKLPFYDGTGIVDTATQYNHEQNSVIYVRGNYRLGAFGWLAGTYMEEHGQPNAGLLDQRAILQFVHDHIADLQGNPKAVSVWGESAGASSIMHHLVMPQNIEKPLFQRAILQSPAYQWLWDRKGNLNNTFTDFATKVAEAAGCANADMECLRSASSDVVSKVNQDLFQKEACEGIMPVGPSVDGNLIPTIAANSFTNNQVVSLNTIGVSHVDLEVPYSNSTSSTSFIPLPIRKNPQSETAFQAFLGEVFTGPSYASIRAAITSRYPLSLFSDQIARAAQIITDSSFTCNTRFIIDEYISAKTPVYAMDYAIFSSYNASTHASDLLPAFSNPGVDYKPFLKCISDETGIKLWALDHIIQGDTAKGMQEYFSSHAIFGDPNNNIGMFEHHWLKAYVDQCPDGAGQGSCVWNLMKPVETFVGSIWADNQGADEKTASGVCDFWRKAAKVIEDIYNSDETEGTGEGSAWEQQVVLGGVEL